MTNPCKWTACVFDFKKRSVTKDCPTRVTEPFLDLPRERTFERERPIPVKVLSVVVLSTGFLDQPFCPWLSLVITTSARSVFQQVCLHFLWRKM